MALTDNLLAFYKLSDTSDSSGNNRTLTNNGNVSFVSGKLGNAAVFDGSNYLTVSDSFLPDGNSPRTFGLWVKQTGFLGEAVFLQYGTPDYTNDQAFYIGAEGNIFTYSQYGQDLGYFNTLEDQQWHHLVITYDESIYKLYIDNVLVSSNSMNTNTIKSGILGIGATKDGSLPFIGQIDAVGIWNRALSEAEVAALYNNGTGLELPPQSTTKTFRITGKTKFLGKVKINA